MKKLALATLLFVGNCLADHQDYCAEAEEAFASDNIQAKPTYLIVLLSEHEQQMEMGIDPLADAMRDKLVKLFIAHGCDLNELCTFKEYVDLICPEFPMIYSLEQKITILGIAGIVPVWTQVLIDNGAKVCVNNYSALMSIVAIMQKTIQEKYQGVPEKYFEDNKCNDINLDFTKAIIIMFKATTDQDRANFLAQYPKLASVLKLT